MAKVRECRRCSEPITEKRKDAVFCSDLCRVEASKETRRCSRCALAHGTISRIRTVCAPCLVFDMISIEKAELKTLVSWMREQQICFYCGEYGREKEHVIPRRVSLPTWTVLSCRECNSLAGGDALTSVLEKLQAIRAKRAKRYAKLLKMPKWDEDELADITGRLRKTIEAWQMAKETVESQVTWNPLGEPMS